MLRITKTDGSCNVEIKNFTLTHAADDLQGLQKAVLDDIAQKLDEMAVNVPRFDVVEHDKDGNVLCKNIAIPVAEPDGKEVTP